MAASQQISVVVVGLGFGAEFVPIYLDHPDVRAVGICEMDERRRQAVGEKFGITRRYHSLEEVLADETVDAVHLLSGIPDHARHAVAVLEAGKHCACTVPMATSLDDLAAVVRAQRAAAKRYMMMETAVYTRQFLYAKMLREQGEFGRIQFLRGAHYQDMEGWPPYWAGLPPMWYATHAIAPLLAIAETRALRVHAFGSGVMRPELQQQYQNPWPVETAIYQLADANMAMEVTRTLFHCARPYMESFTVYGENGCYEWQMEDEPPMLFRMTPVQPNQRRKVMTERPAPPDRAELLPAEVGKYTKRFVYSAQNQHLSFEQGGGHHGSHPHLVHEFVRSIVEDRTPAIDAVTAANWTAAGICAHTSAMQGGVAVEVPDFGRLTP